MSSIIVDVENQRRAEEALADSERRYRLLAENSTDMVSLIDPEGVFLWVSPGVRLVLGYQPSDLIGTKGTDLVHPDDLAVVPPVAPVTASATSAALAESYPVDPGCIVANGTDKYGGDDTPGTSGFVVQQNNASACCETCRAFGDNCDSYVYDTNGFAGE
jgi:hypothetical protein